jgi:two-component system, LytTR family, response regulator
MSSKMKVLIVDDESLARELVRNYLKEMPDVEVLGECANGFEALKAVQELCPDLLFLDIQMPKIDGFELLEVLDPRPEIIFCTAYDQYAIRAFEMNAVDYLLKPFSRERLQQAVDKAKQRIGTPSQIVGTPSPLENLKQHLDDDRKVLERVITRLGSKVTVIPVDRIHFLESADDYVMIHSELGSHLKERTMKYFEEHLPPDYFIRIHRSYIVNISVIKSLELYSKDSYLAILRNGEKLKVSAEGYKRLREKF